MLCPLCHKTQMCIQRLTREKFHMFVHWNTVYLGSWLQNSSVPVLIAFWWGKKSSAFCTCSGLTALARIAWVSHRPARKMLHDLVLVGVTSRHELLGISSEEWQASDNWCSMLCVKMWRGPVLTSSEADKYRGVTVLSNDLQTPFSPRFKRNAFPDAPFSRVFAFSSDSPRLTIPPCS